MNELAQNYQIAKQNSIQYMITGQINAYFDALIEMNFYKKLMKAVVSN